MLCLPALIARQTTSAQVQARLAEFGSGVCNLLICTVVAEEGMDIPEANVVIRFDPMQHAVSFVQVRREAIYRCG